MNASASIYEKLGVFYLGREFDLQQRHCRNTPVLYDSRDLLTHAVIMGMTGSGKTGLGISLLEEAAIDSIPALIIDPKGDLGNLLLTFPDLGPADFAPWVHAEDAQRAGLSVDAFAARQATNWREGLAQWDQAGERIAKLREAAEFQIYTPGSEAGRPVSILASFAVPPPAIMQDTDLLRDCIATTTSSLLGLLGLTADPLRSREHILLAHILENAWRQGQDLDLGTIIQRVQNPPFSQVGVLDLESFFPSRERFEMAIGLNNLLAAPGFASWLQGESLDVDRLLYSPQGKPRLSIFSIGHLSDAERMFFVSLLLNQTLGWMRSRPGTTSLRALLYIDELMGYMPPVSEPPSKRPLLTLLKQARAFGLGVVLATQNPVDLDYKGLANTGTWFIGRLQTERDRQRVLEGLSGTTVAATQALQDRDTSSLLAELGQRVFLMHNVHEDAPVVFQTRWTMSFLAGPLTRPQIRSLVTPRDERRQESSTPQPSQQPQPSQRPQPVDSPQPSGSHAAGVSSTRPLLPPELPQVFLPLRTSLQTGPLVYQPQLLAAVHIHYAQARKSLFADERLVLLLPVEADSLRPDWSRAQSLSLSEDDLDRAPEQPCSYTPVPTLFGQSKHYGDWRKTLVAHLYHTQRYDLLRSVNLDECARPDESERDFRVRLLDKAREQRDQQAQTLRQKYASKIRVLEDRVRRAQQAVEREAQEASSAKTDSMISIGATVLDALLGRKRISSGRLGRATSAARGLGRASRQADQVRQAHETLAAYEQQLFELQAELAAELQQIEQRLDPLHEEFQVIQLKPRKTDVDVRLLALAWCPVAFDAAGRCQSHWEG